MKKNDSFTNWVNQSSKQRVSILLTSQKEGQPDMMHIQIKPECDETQNPVANLQKVQRTEEHGELYNECTLSKTRLQEAMGQMAQDLQL